MNELASAINIIVVVDVALVLFSRSKSVFEAKMPKCACENFEWSSVVVSRVFFDVIYKEKIRTVTKDMGFVFVLTLFACAIECECVYSRYFSIYLCHLCASGTHSSCSCNILLPF